MGGGPNNNNNNPPSNRGGPNNNNNNPPSNRGGPGPDPGGDPPNPSGPPGPPDPDDPNNDPNPSNHFSNPGHSDYPGQNQFIKLQAAKLPPFSGDPATDSLGVQEWILNVQEVLNTSGLTPKMKGTYVRQLLRGKASIWLQNENLSKNDLVTYWIDDPEVPSLQTALKERFGHRISMAQRSEMLGTLHLRAGETLLDFLDRCRYIIFKTHENYSGPGKDYALQSSLVTYFVNGISAQVREQLLYHAPEAPTYKQLRDIVVKISDIRTEVTKQSQPHNILKLSVAAAAADPQQPAEDELTPEKKGQDVKNNVAPPNSMEASIAAMQKQLEKIDSSFSRFPNRARGRPAFFNKSYSPNRPQTFSGPQRRGNSRGRGRNNRGGTRQNFNKTTGKGNCFVCGKPDHWANKCPQKQTYPQKGRNPNRQPYSQSDVELTVYQNYPNFTRV